MKILFNLQPLQGENSYREIGRVTMEMSKRLISKIEKPYALLNNFNQKKGIQVKQDIKNINPGTSFEVLEIEGFTTYFDIYCRNKTIEGFLPYELLLEWRVSQINPDIFFTFSFFEWDHPTSIRKLMNGWLNFVIAYDLIPYIFKEQHLSEEHLYNWYMHKLDEFKKADIFFAISEHTKNDFIKHLGVSEEKIKVIPLGCDEIFKPLSEEELKNSREALKTLGIKKEFILYVPSGIEKKKNIEGLIKAYSLLDKNLKENYYLVIASKIDEVNQNRLEGHAKSLGVEKNVIFTGYIPEETLIGLYNLCSLLVYPSYYEGFGLPVLEAMNCGAPVICSNNSSLKELTQIKEALFDPYKTEDMAKKISIALTDHGYRKLLIENSKTQSKRYSWDKAVEIILNTIEEQVPCKVKI